MTLKTLIKGMELMAASQPSVNMIVENDIFRLNEKADARYGVFAWTQGQHQGSTDSSLMSYTFSLFYVDRLTEDRSNQIEIQSVGIQTISNILRRLDENGVYVDSYTFQPFNQRFSDECAGVFCNVTMQAPTEDGCAETFGAFNDDFDEDFMIY